MILQISDRDHLIIRCHTFDNMPEMQDFCISIHDNHLNICRNGGEDMKIHLGELGKVNFSKSIKSKPLKKGVVSIKLEKE